MAAKRWAFCNGYTEVVFLCNGTDRHEILAKNINCLLNLHRRILKISLKGVILPLNRHFWAALTGFRVTGLQVMGITFFDLAKTSVY